MSESLVAQLAAFFRAHPFEFIDGRVLASIAGFYAFRTRCSDLRRPPFNMRIVNRQRRVTITSDTMTTFTVSEYCFQPGVGDSHREGAAVDVEAPAAAV